MSENPTTLFVGQNRIYKDVIDSTNSLAAALLGESKLPEGTVILAKQQTAGRGQMGTTWESEYGHNLLASFIFYPTFLSPKNIFYLNIMCSLALHDWACEQLGKEASVKWPNDLYYQNKKLAGMLIENSIRNNDFNYAIIGIGLNVNQVVFSPNAVNPVSIKMVLGKEQHMEDVLNLLCECLEARYLQLKSARHEALRNEYLQVLYKYNTPCDFKADGKDFTGIIKDVLEDGKLVVETDGITKAYNFKEISFTTESR